MDDFTMFGLLLLLFASLCLLLPVLAISAFVRVRRLERKITELPGPEVRSQLTALRHRLTEIERRLASLSAVASAESQPITEDHTAQPHPTPPVPSFQPVASAPASTFRDASAQPPTVILGKTSTDQAQRTADAMPENGGERQLPFDLETLIAGQWLNRVGVLALLFAMAFLMKYAYDNEWIGNRGRIIAGLMSGGLLILYSEWLLRRGYRYFSEGIAGLGVAVLYLSLYTGWGYYNLFSQHTAFAGMIVVTVTTALLAVRRNSQSIAALGLIGGFLTPLLLSTGRDQQIALFTYLAVLNASLLGLAQWREWRSLELLAFFPTQLYLWGWYISFYEPSKLTPTLTFATLFYLLYNALILVRHARTGGLLQSQLPLLGLNNILFLLMLSSLLWPERRIALTLAVLTLASAHLLAARFLKPFSGPPRAGELFDARLLFIGLALFYASLSIPIYLQGASITMVWAVEGAVLIWAGLLPHAGARRLRQAGLVLFALVALRLMLWPDAPISSLPDARLIQFAAALFCFAVALYLVRNKAASLEKDEQQLFSALAVAGNALAVYGLSLEVWDRFGRGGGSQWFDASLAQQLGLSLLWTLYASGLIVYGVRRKAPELRWLALALFGLTVGKVFLYDVWLLERAYRIASFVALGVVLLIVSFLYQRRLTSGEEEQP